MHKIDYSRHTVNHGEEVVEAKRVGSGMTNPVLLVIFDMTDSEI